MRGTVIMNAGIAPGMTNLIAAQLLEGDPEDDEIGMAFTISAKGTSGRAGGDFCHRNLTAIKRHRTTRVPLPGPFGDRRCLGFGEPEDCWLDGVKGAHTTHSYVCIAGRPVHGVMLALNRAGVISKLPRIAFGANPAADDSGSSVVGQPVGAGSPRPA